MPPRASAARPKRAGEDFARDHDDTQKKPRFDHRNPSTLAADAPEEDVILDADVIGKSGAQTKRNAVNIDGYDSDSDGDNFDARAAERARGAEGTGVGGGGRLDENEDDMFADLEEGRAQQGTRDGEEDEEVGREGKRRVKDVRFLGEGEIEGQVMGSKSGGHVGAELLVGGKGKGRETREVEEESSSGGEEERDELPGEMEDEFATEVGAGGKKKHAPRLDAFNLKEEEEEGKYDESGNFVRKAADPDADNDTWLDGLTKKDMKRAREAQEQRDNEERRKAAASDALLTSDILSNLIQHLETGETPLEALQRLNKGKRKEAKVPKWKQKKQGKMDVDGTTDTPDPAEAARKQALDSITAAADALYTREQHEIYDTEREVLMRQFRREAGEDWQPIARQGDSAVVEGAGEEAAWIFRWSDGGEEHGPYDAAAMKAWQDAGYFGEGVEFRRAAESEWTRVLNVR